ncbi:MAG: hypothetical protein AAF501_17735, partial [Pseudomonadota bacterium]
KEKLGAVSRQFKKLPEPSKFVGSTESETADYRDKHRILAREVNHAVGQYKETLNRVTLLQDTLDNLQAKV